MQAIPVATTESTKPDDPPSEGGEDETSTAGDGGSESANRPAESR